MSLKNIKFPLYAQTLTALLLGVIWGLFFWPRGEALAPLAKGIIWVIMKAAIPLLFLAILDTVLKAEFSSRSLLSLIGVATLNATGAVTIGLLLSNAFHPGRYLKLTSTEAPTQLKALEDLTVGHAVSLFFSSPMIVAILSAILLGIVFHLFGKRWFSLERATQVTDQALTRWISFMGYLLYLVPWAVFAAVGKVVGEHGFSLVQGLLVYLLFCLGGMAIHILIVYHSWIRLFYKMPLRTFWRAAREPVVHAFGINSSLATLPFTLKALDKLKISPASARLSACLGTNFNNDGILLYEVVAALFLAQAYGVDLPLWQQLAAAGVCVIATVGVGGIPEAGIISLGIVVSILQLPLEGITILLTVDWIIARCRSSTNLLGDMTVAIALEGLKKRSV